MEVTRTTHLIVHVNKSELESLQTSNPPYHSNLWEKKKKPQLYEKSFELGNIDLIPTLEGSTVEALIPSERVFTAFFVLPIGKYFPLVQSPLEGLLSPW